MGGGTIFHESCHNHYIEYLEKSKIYYKYEQEIRDIKNMLEKLMDSKRFPKIIQQIKEILYE